METSSRCQADTFRSTRVISEPDGRWTVEGDLTVRDITRPVSALVDITGAIADPWGKTRGGIHAETKINRRDFGLVTDLDRETGGYPVGSDVTIIVDSEGLLQVASRLTSFMEEAKSRGSFLQIGEMKDMVAAAPSEWHICPSSRLDPTISSAHHTAAPYRFKCWKRRADWLLYARGNHSL